jgi:hypothetical protein
MAAATAAEAAAAFATTTHIQQSKAPLQEASHTFHSEN